MQIIANHNNYRLQFSWHGMLFCIELTWHKLKINVLLQFEHCRCLNSRNNLHTTDPEDCKSEKRHKYFDVYRTINITEGKNNQQVAFNVFIRVFFNYYFKFV